MEPLIGRAMLMSTVTRSAGIAVVTLANRAVIKHVEPTTTELEVVRERIMGIDVSDVLISIVGKTNTVLGCVILITNTNVTIVQIKIALRERIDLEVVRERRMDMYVIPVPIVIVVADITAREVARVLPTDINVTPMVVPREVEVGVLRALSRA